MPHRTLAEQVHSGFPGALRTTDLIARLEDQCTEMGFVASSSLLIVGVCRDELCFPFVAHLEDTWGPAFHIGSLGGLLTIGRTGVAAAFGHAPEDPGAPHRYLVVAGPHIGMDEVGEFGHLRREHQWADSGACGALMALRDELARGPLDLAYDPHDPEMSLLRQRVGPTLAQGPVPDPVGLTKLVARVIDQDLDDLISWRAAALAGAQEVRVAQVTGVLIHTRGGDWFEPHRSRFWSSRSGEVALDLGDPGMG